MVPKSGYKIFDKVISKKTSIHLFNIVNRLCQFYSPEIFNKKKYKNNWIDIEFNKKLINLRKKNRKVFAAIYDTLLKSNALNKFCYDNKFDIVAAKFLGVNKDYLTIRSCTLRMDVPNDRRNLYGWHQDSAYDNFNTSSTNGVVLWAPLINTSKKNGTLMVKPESQNEGNVCNLTKKGGKYSSVQITASPKFLKKYKTKSVNVKKNSALATYSGIFHKSGDNSSNKVRFVFIVRFNKILSKDFIHFRNTHSISGL